jgi:hypothetical protein
MAEVLAAHGGTAQDAAKPDESADGTRGQGDRGADTKKKTRNRAPSNIGELLALKKAIAKGE